MLRAALLLLLLAPAAHGAKLKSAPSPLAAAPPMGWNSWDSYGLSVTADEWKQNVDWLHAHLQAAGWQYAVVDEGWYLRHPNLAQQTGAAPNASVGYSMDANGVGRVHGLGGTLPAHGSALFRVE